MSLVTLPAWHILIVDDNSDDRADFRQMLLKASTRQYRFTEAQLGKECLTKIHENTFHPANRAAYVQDPYDCVLLDYHLPDMDAPQILATLCHGTDLPPCPIVVITGWDGVDSDEGPKLLRSGAQDYISKSWTTPESLTRAIENSIERFSLLVEAKEVQEELRKSEERYRTLFDSIDEGYCIVQMIFDASDRPLDYRFLEVSKSFGHQTGFINAQNKTILELVPDMEAFWIDTFGQVALTGKATRFENKSKRMNRWFDVYAFRFDGAEHRQVAVLFNDITQRKEAELKLQNAIATAESANQAKSDFLANMSHELRTPLNAILGFAQLMEAADPPPNLKQKQSLAHIVTSGWYLLGLINETLDLAAVESGMLSISAETLILSTVMQECEAMVEPLAQQRSISIAFPQFDTPVYVHADRVRVKQILVNLLSNAIKYNRVGGHVDITCATQVSGNVRISVQDTGEGIPPEKLDQLFKPFNRLGHDTSAVQGTGIGLVMCKRLAQLMGGTIGVESTPGQGSVFWVKLKAAAPQTAPLNLVTPIISAADLRSAVLHVDDNPASLELVEHLMAQRPQHRTLSASHGGLGLEFARAHQPVVILMDINLPGMSGIETLEKLRADPLTAHIPVLALSANAMPHEIKKGLEAGFFRYMTKPIKVHEFFETLDEALAFASSPAGRPTAKEVPQ